MSSAGTSDALPPPVPPPFTPKTGPSDGSRSARTAFLPRRRIPIARPIEVVVFPSPLARGPLANGAELDLRLAAPVELEVFVSKAQLLGDGLDGAGGELGHGNLREGGSLS